MTKTFSKRQNLVQNKNIDVQNLKNKLSTLLVFFIGIFWHYATSLKFFGLHQWVFPSFVSMDVKKSQRVPFYIFRHCDTVQKSHFVFFWKISEISPGFPLQFFQTFCNQLEFHEAQSVPGFTLLSLIYSAGFGRSRLVKNCHQRLSF